MSPTSITNPDKEAGKTFLFCNLCGTSYELLYYVGSPDSGNLSMEHRQSFTCINCNCKLHVQKYPRSLDPEE